MHRTQSSCSERVTAVPVDRPSAQQLVLRARRRITREPRADEADRRAVPQVPVLRDEEGMRAVRNQSEAGSATYAADGARGRTPEAIDQPPRPRAQDLSLFAAGYHHHTARPGLGERHHLHPIAAWLPLPDGGDGPLQPQRSVVEALQHSGRRLLCGRTRRGFVASTPRDLQYGSRSPVHVTGLHEPIREEWCGHLDGRSRPSPRQRVDGAALAVTEVRGGLPKGTIRTAGKPRSRWTSTSTSTATSGYIRPWPTAPPPRSMQRADTEKTFALKSPLRRTENK